MIEVVNPAINTKLTTVDAVLSEIGDADAILIDNMIQQASDFIQRYCNRIFAKQIYRETVAGYGTQRLILSRIPILQVLSIIADNEVITDYVVEDANAGILYRRRGWQWTPAIGWHIVSYPLPNTEAMLYTVEYIAGFVLPDQTDRTLPGDVERACIELVKVWYNDLSRDARISSERIGDYQVTYEQQEMPPKIAQLLAPWKMMII